MSGELNGSTFAHIYICSETTLCDIVVIKRQGMRHFKVLRSIFSISCCMEMDRTAASRSEMLPHNYIED